MYQTLQTPDGPFSILEDAQGAVIASGWTSDLEELVERIRPASRDQALTEGVFDVGETAAAPAVEAYYAGDPEAVRKVVVRQFGTDLQTSGWEALRAIEPGVPLTYTEFAASLGRPQAARAAASVCARNAVALFVPCHRVLRGDGSLGGFAWGAEVKKSLLEREKAAREQKSKPSA